jgi:lysophospholipid acyltransferase (LPLAT)-like uncharacterized protein
MSFGGRCQFEGAVVVMDGPVHVTRPVQAEGHSQQAQGFFIMLLVRARHAPKVVFGTDVPVDATGREPVGPEASRRAGLVEWAPARYSFPMNAEPDDPRGSHPEPPTPGQRLTAWCARGLIRGLGRSLRWSTRGEEHLAAARRATPSGRVVFAFWHGDQFPLVYTWRARDVVIMTSLSRDGTLQSLILGGLGYHIVRGSSSRGAVRGLVGMIRATGEGRDAAFAVDGPRGPYHEVKPGALFLARRTGLPVVPLTSQVARARIFTDAWDRYVLPHPFSPVAVVYGEHLMVPEGADEAAMEGSSRELGERLARLDEQARAALNVPVRESPGRG